MYVPAHYALKTIKLSFQNAFSDRLSQYGFDLFPMLVVDVMHEVELGVWKHIFIHMLRILESSSSTPGATHALDSRYVSELVWRYHL